MLDVQSNDEWCALIDTVEDLQNTPILADESYLCQTKIHESQWYLYLFVKYVQNISLRLTCEFSLDQFH